jgi:hypothetical protein
VKPEPQYRSFNVLLLDRDNPPATPYDKVWQFEDLIKWIVTKSPSLSGKPIICWSDIVFRDADYAEMILVNIGKKRPRMMANHGRWVTCILAAQENKNKPARFPGLGIKVSVESEHQGHNDNDLNDLGGD